MYGLEGEHERGFVCSLQEKEIMCWRCPRALSIEQEIYGKRRIHILLKRFPVPFVVNLRASSYLLLLRKHSLQSWVPNTHPAQLTADVFECFGKCITHHAACKVEFRSFYLTAAYLAKHFFLIMYYIIHHTSSAFSILGT